MKPHWVLLIVLVGGCAEPKPDVAVVTSTLQTYRVGVTTFADLKRDARLVMVEQRITNPPPIPRSYLMQQAGVTNPALLAGDVIYNNKPPTVRTVHVYGVPSGSPWKIYETGETESFINWKHTRTQEFVVGDINKPISILSFDERGNLVGISPVSLPNTPLEPTATAP